MKKIVRQTLVAACLAATGAAHALSFDTAAGSTFTHWFSVVTTQADTLTLSVSGPENQYSALSFELLSGVPTVVAAPAGGFLKASFNDTRNTSISLPAGNYSLKVSGVTKSATPGTFGVVTIGYGTTFATITPVPEPESYAMMLLGLGLIGSVAYRRRKQDNS